MSGATINPARALRTRTSRRISDCPGISLARRVLARPGERHVRCPGYAVENVLPALLAFAVFAHRDRLYLQIELFFQVVDDFPRSIAIIWETARHKSRIPVAANWPGNRNAGDIPLHSGCFRISDIMSRLSLVTVIVFIFEGSFRSIRIFAARQI